MRAIWEHLDLNLPNPARDFNLCFDWAEDEGAQGTKFMSRTMMNGARTERHLKELITLRNTTIFFRK